MGRKRKHKTESSPASAAAAAELAGQQSEPTPVRSKPTARQTAQPARAHSHVHTDAAPTGLGQQLAALPGRRAQEPLPALSTSQPAAKWAPPTAARSCCLQNPTASVELELARAAALDQLRHKLASLAAKAKLRNVPLLAFERWRFAAKWAEDEPHLAAAAVKTAAQDASAQQPAGAASKLDSSSKPSQQQAARQQKSRQLQHSSDPVVPFGTLPVAPEPGLVADLTRAGVDAAAAVSVATQLASAAQGVAASLVKKRQQLASGKPSSCSAVCVEFHKHSLDLRCDGMFVKISRPAYGKLAQLYRQHWLDTAEAAGAAVGLPPEDACQLLARLQTSCPPTAAAAAGGEEGQQDPAPAKRRKLSNLAAAAAAAGDSSSDECGSEEEADTGAGGDAAGPSGCAVAGSSCPKRLLLDAEAQLAELELTQQGLAGGAAGSAGEAQHSAAAAAAAAEKPGSSSGGGSGRVRAGFHARLFALLLRYKAIQGHGFQAAAGPPVFDLLRQQLSVGYECFASPLNAHFSGYGSAFPDVDAPFGSGGSFFRMKMKYGSYEVNPPFVPSLLTAAAQHILHLLEVAEAAGSALSFAVLMPGWHEVTGWQMLNSSSFLRQSLLVAAADHGYCDGASHQRRDLYRQSPYDSSLMFLQTTAAARKWPVRQPLLHELQVAFAACCPSAAAAGRQKKQRGHADLEAKGYGVPVKTVAH